MLQLVQTTRIELNVEKDTVYILNGSERPIQGPVAGNPIDLAVQAVKVLKPKVVELFRVTDDAAARWIDLLNDEIVNVVNDPDSYIDPDWDDNQSNRTHHIPIHKFSKGIPLAEAILIDGKPRFLQIEYVEVKPRAKLSKEIALDEKNILYSPDKLSYNNIGYEFSSEEEINTYIDRASKENLDTLYNRVKSIFEKYADRDKFHITICSADIIFTYFQDRLGMTHYLLFVGDNTVGKTGDLTMIQQLGYRALCDLSITPANIYRSLGSVEEGQGIVLEDEIDDLDEQKEKMKIYKGGYISGKRVTRSDYTTSGRKSQGFWTYCFKAFTAEKQPDSSKAKAFNERTFVLKCSPGTPEYDITEVISPAGDEEFEAQLEKLIDTRRLLLVYRQLHHDRPIPNIELNIKNRDKQLCKPILRLFQGTKSVEGIRKSLSYYLKEKRNRKAVTVEAILHGAVNLLVDLELKNEPKQKSLDRSVVLDFSKIWLRFVDDISGEISSKHPKSVDTSEYGTISQQTISSILRDRFGGEDARDKKKHEV